MCHPGLLIVAIEKEMNLSFTQLSIVIGQAGPSSNEMFATWVVRMTGPLILILPVLTMAMIVGAVWLVIHRCRPAQILSCFAVLPLPFVVTVLFVLMAYIKWLSLISIVGWTPTNGEVADLISETLLPIFLSLLMTLPSYLILTYGLIVSCSRQDQSRAMKEVDSDLALHLDGVDNTTHVSKT